MTETLLPAPAVGVGALVFNPDGRVLLIRRGKPPAQGLWSLPGGRLEPGETLVGCCVREVFEETGLEVEPGPIVAVAERVAEGFHYVIVDFLAVPKSPLAPEPVPATDVSEARWVNLAELAAYPLVEGLGDVIHAARASSASGLGDTNGAGWLFLPGRSRHGR